MNGILCINKIITKAGTRIKPKLTCDVTSPASQHNLDRAFVQQGKVHIPSLVHSDCPEIKNRLRWRGWKELN